MGKEKLEEGIVLMIETIQRARTDADFYCGDDADEKMQRAACLATISAVEPLLRKLCQAYAEMP